MLRLAIDRSSAVIGCRSSTFVRATACSVGCGPLPASVGIGGRRLGCRRIYSGFGRVECLSDSRRRFRSLLISLLLYISSVICISSVFVCVCVCIYCLFKWSCSVRYLKVWVFHIRFCTWSIVLSEHCHPHIRSQSFPQQALSTSHHLPPCLSPSLII